MRSVRCALLLAAFLAPARLVAQDSTMSATNMEILKDKLKADKKLVVASNMNLTDAEAAGFWPVYDAYQKDLDAINARLLSTIQQYAAAYNANSMTDDTAKQLISQATQIDVDEAQLQKDYTPKLLKVLPATKVARYLQIERKIRAVKYYELADQIPLVQ